MAMDATRWTQINALFNAVLEQAVTTRDAFLQTACKDDPDLLAEVRSLLAADADAHPLFDSLALDAMVLPADLLPDGILPAAGERVGPYRIVRPLGHGGMGAVFLAARADGQFEQQVALKLIRGGAGSTQIVRRFQSERQILARLHHPHIARLLDGGLTEDGQPYFAMEYIDGVPLDQHCAAHACSIEERIQLIRAACDAVQSAHRQLVVHRDLKPANILVTVDGQVKLLDFGIAKMLSGVDHTISDPMNHPALTQTGHAVMTPAYAAPEQLRHEPVSTATDVYALGIVLYELLVGERPFDLSGCSPAEIERIVSTQLPRLPSMAAPAHRKRQLRGDLDTIVLKALRKEPDRRYASAEALAADLQRHVDGRPVQARPDTAGYRTRKFIQRHRAGVTTTAAVFVLIAALVSFYTTQLAQERDRAQLEAVTATQVSNFLQDLFVMSDPSETGGAEVTARMLLDEGAARIERELTGQPAVQARMMQVMGEVYLTVGALDAADPLLERSLTLRRTLPDAPPLDVAASLTSLAGLRYETGAYATADSLYRAALAIQEEHQGPDDPVVAATLHRLGWVLFRQGEYEQADALYQRALAIRTTQFGESDPQTASTLSHIAGLRYEQDDLDAAETLYRRALIVRQAHFEHDHRDVATSLNDLAMVLGDKGAFDEAEAYYREALAMRERLYDGHHADVAHSLNTLAHLYWLKREYTAAEPFARRGLAMRIDVLGEEHVATAASMATLIRILDALGQHAEAADTARRALEIVKATMGAEHPYVASFHSLLAAALHAAGTVTDAEHHYRESLTLNRALFPEGNTTMVGALTGLGALLMETGRPAEVEPLLREAIALAINRWSADHWQVPDLRSRLGASLTEAGRYAEAESLLVESHATLLTSLGPDHARVLRAEERLDRLYAARGQQP